VTITATELIAMDDRTMATHASGGFGVPKRQEFIAAVRRAALAETRTAEPVTFATLMGSDSNFTPRQADLKTRQDIV
jgi:hypothetical protein